MKTSYTPQEVRELLNELEILVREQGNLDFHHETSSGDYSGSSDGDNEILNWNYERWLNSKVPDVKEGVQYCQPLVGQTSFTIEPKSVQKLLNIF